MHRICVALLVLLAAAGCARRTAAGRPSSIPRVAPAIVRMLPHDTTAFTQGLLFHDGTLLESTGAPRGTGSSLRLIDAATGTVTRMIDIPNTFCEGIALLGDRLVQLSWRDQTAIVYSYPACTYRNLLGYSGEGWGLTSDGTVFYMSNGSDTLYVRDDAFRILRTIAVTYDGRPLRSLNELEYRAGRIYANVWYSNFVFEIDPAKGSVMRVIDCTALVDSARVRSPDDVLNGIAVDARAGTVYLTGKNWRAIFEVRIP